MKKKLKKTIVETSLVFSLLVWLYVIAMQIAHPESVSWTFTYWLRVRMDYIGEIAFIISIISFFVLRYKYSKTA